MTTPDTDDATRRDWLAEESERHRGHLRAVGYRMLGSVSEAEDAFQEVWLRLDRSDPGATDDLRGWLTVVVGRICLDILRKRKARNEQLAGYWRPEPIVRSATDPEPEHDMIMADSVGLALRSARVSITRSIVPKAAGTWFVGRERLDGVGTTPPRRRRPTGTGSCSARRT